MDEITIVVVEDHPLFRQGVINTLTMEPDFQVVGQASDGGEGLSLIRKLKPMIAVVDVNLPGLNGQQVTRRIMRDKLGTRVILLTAYDDPEQQIHALRAGAFAYCNKDIQPDRLVNIIRLTCAGNYVVGDQAYDQESISNWLSGQAGSEDRFFSDPDELYQPLSAREMEVLVEITKGLSNKEIAVLLGISHQTVKNHITAILRKLGVEDRTQAALFALRRGWIRLYENDKDAEE